MRRDQAFFFLLLLLAPTQLGFHFWTDWASVLGRRVDYLSPTIFLTDILIFLTVGSWIFKSISKINIKNQKLQIFLLILLFTLLNIFVATDKFEAVYKWLKIYEFGLLAAYIMVTKPRLSRVIFPLTVGVFYSSLLAIGQFFLQHSLGGPLWWLGERTFAIDTPGIARIELCDLSHISCRLLLRPYATFPHPNVLAGFLAVTLPLTISHLSNKKYFYFLSILVGLVALALTFSRSALVIAAIGIGWTSWTMIKAKVLKNLLLLAGVVLMLVAFLQFRSVSLADESVLVRQQLNSAAITLWQRSPVFGIGLGNFIVNLPEVLPLRAIYFLQPVHNIYLLVLAETGMLGLLLFLWLTMVSVKGMLGRPRLSIINYQFGLVSLLLLGLVDHYPFDLQQGQLLLTLLFALSWVRRSS